MDLMRFTGRTAGSCPGPWEQGRQVAFSLVVLLFVGFLGQGAVRAQTNAHTCLFVVEASRTMQRRSAGVYDTLARLLETSLERQLRGGDRVDYWFYNEKVVKAEINPAVWSPQRQREISMGLLALARAQRYENRAAFENLLPELQNTFRQSRVVTVLVIGSGEAEVAGTPFDKQINAAYQQWREEQARIRMPLVTFLRAVDGRLIHWAVIPAPWPADLPPLPELAATKGLGAAPAMAKVAVTNSGANIEAARGNSSSPAVAKQNQAGTTRPAVIPNQVVAGPATGGIEQTVVAKPAVASPSAPAGAPRVPNNPAAVVPRAAVQRTNAPKPVVVATKLPATVAVGGVAGERVGANEQLVDLDSTPVGLPLAEPVASAAMGLGEVPPALEESVRALAGTGPGPATETNVGGTTSNEPAREQPAVSGSAANPVRADVRDTPAAPRPSMLAENAVWVAISGLLGCGSLACFYMWIQTYWLRNRPPKADRPTPTPKRAEPQVPPKTEPKLEPETGEPPGGS